MPKSNLSRVWGQTAGRSCKVIELAEDVTPLMFNTWLMDHFVRHMCSFLSLGYNGNAIDGNGNGNGNESFCTLIFLLSMNLKNSTSLTSVQLKYFDVSAMLNEINVFIDNPQSPC